tara:strand:- start:10613 stop:11470 length:858 start_codon:yes stop_codon:yes gene_type:complete
MKKVIVISFVLLLIIIGLEVNNIVPSTIMPSLIATHDAIKTNPHILVFITNIKTFIVNFEVKPYLDAFDASLISTYAYIISLPWEKINVWYLLGIIFFIGVISEKFRTLSNEIKFINQKLTRIKREILSDDSKSNDDLKANITEDLRSDAANIMSLLTDIKKTTDSLKSTELRSKKLRREITLMSNLNELETEVIDEDNESQKTVMLPENNFEEQASSTTNSGNDDNESVELDIYSDDISPLDLARTYIEANELDKADSIIKRIVQTGTEHEKHEAKLLFMQLRK